MLTTEQLRAIAEEELDACSTLDAAKLMARELLSNREAQPVAYLNKFSGVCMTLEQQPNAADDAAVYVPLYTAPPAPAVPEEAKLGEMPFLGKSERGYVRGWSDCRAAMLKGEKS